MCRVFPPASPGSSTRCFMWPSHLRVRLHALVLQFTLAAATCTRAFCSPCLYSLFRFHFLSSAVLHADSFHHQVQLRSALHRNVPRKLTPRHRHPSEIKQCLPPGSMSRFLAKHYMAILPPCDWRTSGTEWQRGGHKIPLKEQMLASSWHMPPRWSRVDGNWRGKAGDVEGEGRRRVLIWKSKERAEKWGYDKRDEVEGSNEDSQVHTFVQESTPLISKS